MASVLSNNSFVTSEMLELSNKDYVTLYKNKIINSYSTLKISSPMKSLSEIAKELNISSSSLKKIVQESGYDSGRKKHQYTTDEKQNIAIKGAITRQRRVAIKEDIERIKSSNLSTKEQITELENLQNRMNTSSVKEVKIPNAKKKKNRVKAGTSHVQFPAQLLDAPSSSSDIRDQMREEYKNDVKGNLSNTIKRDQSPLQQFLEERERGTTDEDIERMMRISDNKISNILNK